MSSLDNLVEEGNQYMDECGETLASLNPTIQLQDFDAYFRDFFVGNVPDDDLKRFGDAWLRVAGATTIPVDIVDGSVVITVPPLHDTTAIDVSGGIISRAARARQRQEVNLPALASKNFAAALQVFTETHVENKPTWGAFHKWLGVEVTADPVKAEPTFSHRSVFG